MTNQRNSRTAGPPPTAPETPLETLDDKPHATLIHVTPTIATDWITRNRSKNRKISTAAVMKYAEDIRAGRWLVNGEAIVLGKTGNILDGQHRLLAVIEAGRPIETFVISQIDDDSFQTLDSGKPRTPADVLGMMGFPNVSELAALGRLDVIYKRYGGIAENGRLIAPTTQEVVSMVTLNEDIYQNAIHMSAPIRRLFGSGAIFAFYWIRLGDLDESDRDFFFGRLNDGLGLMEGDPVYALRQALLNAKTGHRMMSRQWIGGMTIKAWNRYRNHDRIRLLAFSATEAYPEPI